MEVLNATSGAIVVVPAVASDSVAVVRSRLQLETGTAPEMQILLARFGAEAGAPVRELHSRVRGQAASLADHRLEVPLGKAVRVCVFDKAFMQPGGVAPMERLNRFEQQEAEGLRAALGALQRRCELQRSQLGEQMARQANRAEASRVAVAFLRGKGEVFRAAVAEFEGKWKVMALHHPALIASAGDDLERLQSTRVRPELGLKEGRTLWDLYTQNSEPEMILFVRKSQQEHEALAGKIKRCLETCKNVLRDAGELAARPYEPLEPLESAHQRLMKLTQVTLPFLERKLMQEGEGSVAAARGLQQAEQEYEQAVNEAETFINNYTLSIQLRLQGVTTLSQGVWQQQEQIKGVLGIAVDRLMQRFHALLIVHELPALQNAIADEAVKRVHFRERVAATFRGLEAALEPFLVDETNRRAGFLSDKHPFVRDFVASRFEWIRDEPLSLGLPLGPGFGRKVPVAASPANGSSLPLIEIGSSPFPPSPATVPPPSLPPRKDKEEMDEKGAHNNVGNGGEDLINEYTERIAYLERSLRERVERSTQDVQRLKLETRQQEGRLLEENSMLKSELSMMEQTLSQYHSAAKSAEAVPVQPAAASSLPQPPAAPSPPNAPAMEAVAAAPARRDNVVVLSDYAVGDRVAFVLNPQTKFFEALLSKNVFLSEANCAAFSQMKLPPVFCGVVVDEPATRVATAKDNFFKLPINTPFVELTVEIENAH